MGRSLFGTASCFLLAGTLVSHGTDSWVQVPDAGSQAKPWGQQWIPSLQQTAWGWWGWGDREMLIQNKHVDNLDWHHFTLYITIGVITITVRLADRATFTQAISKTQSWHYKTWQR